MSRKYFGTDGVRGRVGEAPITPEFVLRLGFAAGEVLARGRSGDARPNVLIGKDTRISGYMLEAALEAGLLGRRRRRDAVRADADARGRLSHPRAAPLGRDRDQRVAQPVSGQRHQVLLRRRRQAARRGRGGASRPRSTGRSACRGPAELGKAFRVDDAAGRYIEFCKSTYPNALDLRGLQIVVDCAHGAAYHVAPARVPRARRRRGRDRRTSRTASTSTTRSGRRIPQSLVAAVRQHRADVGIALDGDGDRVLMADGAGATYDGDQLLYVDRLPARQGGPGRRRRRHADDQPRPRARARRGSASASRARRSATATCSS